MAIDLAGPQVEDTRTAGVIARPPLLFLGALMLGFIMDHLVPLRFPISRIGLAHWTSAMIAGSMLLIGLALVTAGSATSLERARRCPRTSPPARW